MRNLILIILSVLVLVGCGSDINIDEGLSPIEGSRLESYIWDQRMICYEKFDSVKFDPNPRYDIDGICSGVENKIRYYAHFGHLCSIMDSTARDVYFLDCVIEIETIDFHDFIRNY